MILFHGFGGNYKIAETLKSIDTIDATLISFNFPDYDVIKMYFHPADIVYGTIQEILPALYVVKKYVIDEGLESIDLYGYSAGGGAIVNLLAVLNSSRYETELMELGITTEVKRQMLEAIQNGLVILDTPLKSVEEIIDLRGRSTELDFIANNYRDNDLDPIDSLALLEGLSLNILLHFQENDEIIYNRDDAIYIERLYQANRQGTTSVIIGSDGGHFKPHDSLWQYYTELIPI